MDYKASMNPWPEKKCQVAEDGQVKSCRPELDAYKVTVFVKPIENIKPPQGEENLPAFANSSDECPFKKESEAKKFLMDYQKDNVVKCYTDGTRIRLTEGGDGEKEIALSKLKATIAIVGAIVSGVVLIYFVVHVLRKHGQERRREPGISTLPQLASNFESSSVGNVAPPQIGYKSGSGEALSITAARLLVQSLKGASAGIETEASNAPCPICLDVFENVLSVHIVHLPCNHQYHEGCITEWFCKGGPSCPYCFRPMNDHLHIQLPE